jgi:G3E family GTPase
MERVRVTLVAGFLGAGKSSLIESVIRRTRQPRVGFLHEDAGWADLFRQIRARTLSPQHDHLFIELHGLEAPIPGEVLETGTHGACVLDSVVTVVDASRFLAELALQGSRARQLLSDQVRGADVLLLNKLDVVSVDEAVRLERELRRLNRLARLSYSIHGFIPRFASEARQRSGPRAPALPLSVSESGRLTL